MAAEATRRAVLDVLAHGLAGDLALSAVGAELGAMLQAGVAADLAEGATRADVLGELRATASEPLVYARLLELVFAAWLEEAELIASLSADSLVPVEADAETPIAPMRRSPRRRR